MRHQVQNRMLNSGQPYANQEFTAASAIRLFSLSSKFLLAERCSRIGPPPFVCLVRQHGRALFVSDLRETRSRSTCAAAPADRLTCSSSCATKAECEFGKTNSQERRLTSERDRSVASCRTIPDSRARLNRLLSAGGTAPASGISAAAAGHFGPGGDGDHRRTCLRRVERAATAKGAGPRDVA